MTFVAGFKCTDGIVLCADRLESDGITKRHRPKIEGMEQDSQWGVAWGVSGTGDVVDKFTAIFKGALSPLKEFNQTDIERAAEATLALIHREYPGYLVQVIVGTWTAPVINQSKTEVAKTLLYRGRSDVQCLAAESRYAIAGMDVTLAEFILRNTFRHMLVEEGIRLSIFVTALMKEYAEGVGGPTDILWHRRGDTAWHDRAPEEVAAIESELQLDEFERTVMEWWRRHR
jgi:20S proteasome alpha/beta subunit